MNRHGRFGAPVGLQPVKFDVEHAWAPVFPKRPDKWIFWALSDPRYVLDTADKFRMVQPAPERKRFSVLNVITHTNVRLGVAESDNKSQDALLLRLQALQGTPSFDASRNASVWNPEEKVDYVFVVSHQYHPLFVKQTFLRCHERLPSGAYVVLGIPQSLTDRSWFLIPQSFGLEFLDTELAQAFNGFPPLAFYVFRKS